MTPGAVTQRAARLADELSRSQYAEEGVETWSVERVLQALWRAGLTLDADLNRTGLGGDGSDVRAALRQLGIEPA